MKQSHKHQGSAHVVVIVILILVILGLLGFVFWQNFIQKKSATKDETTTSKTTKPATTDTTSDVKTYKNTTLGFSLNYPSNWTLTDYSDQDALKIATITSPDTASKTSTNPDGTLNYDVAISAEPQSGSTSGSSSAAVLALKGNASQYASKKYTETINSINVTEYDMYAQSPYFAALFPIGGNYIELDFTVATKADMTDALTQILQSVQPLR